MKLILVITAICICSLQAKAQSTTTSNIDSIQTTINFYFDGWGTGDTTKIGKAMHATCHLKFYRDGIFTEMSRNEYLSRFKPKERLASLITRVVSIDITENIAAAKVEILTEKDIFTDYFNLIRTSEGWFIVDKISVRRAK
jgi:aldose sugar dehydrogenase